MGNKRNGGAGGDKKPTAATVAAGAVQLSIPVLVAGAVVIASVSAGVTIALLQIPAASRGDTVRHLFSTQLYHDNVADKVDFNKIAELALTPFRRIEAGDAVVLDAILESKQEGCRTKWCEKALEDDSLPGETQYSEFTLNDRFFHWQMYHNQGRLPLLKGYDYLHGQEQNPALRQLLDHVRTTALPRYLQTLGVSEEDTPRYRIQAWASVMRDQDSHSFHEHYTMRGNPVFRLDDCLCSGVAYARVPDGSGAIRFDDARQPPL